MPAHLKFYASSLLNSHVVEREEQRDIPLLAAPNGRASYF